MFNFKTSFLILIFLFGISVNAQNKNEKLIDFAGDLQKGKSYSAEIAFDEKFNEWQTVKRLKVPFHHAGRIEWSNLKDFVILKNPDEKKCNRIVFKVVSKKIYQADRNRWNTIYQAKILSLIPDKPC
ncbi:MAG: hypothetical protein AAB336_00475 [Acidobacteriota bacterium]